MRTIRNEQRPKTIRRDVTQKQLEMSPLYHSLRWSSRWTCTVFQGSRIDAGHIASMQSGVRRPRSADQRRRFNGKKISVIFP